MPRTRTIKTIYKWLRSALKPTKPSDVDFGDKVSDYVHGGEGAIKAFLESLNKTPGFNSDGMTLDSTRVKSDPRVRHVLIAILDNYMARGWKVN